MLPLLCMHDLSTRRVIKAVGKVLGNRGLIYQNVVKISGKIAEEVQTVAEPIKLAHPNIWNPRETAYIGYWVPTRARKAWELDN